MAERKKSGSAGNPIPPEIKEVMANYTHALVHGDHKEIARCREELGKVLDKRRKEKPTPPQE